MKEHGKTDRLRELAVAFHRLSRNQPDLRVDPPALRTLPMTDSKERAVFRVRLRSSGGEGQARMLVHDRGGKLETRVGDRKPSASDDLGIDLRRGFRWDAASFADAAQMAEVLYKHMTRRLASATGDAR